MTGQRATGMPGQDDGAPAGVLVLRDAAPMDVPVVLGFIRALATYERQPERCVLTEGALAEALFGTPRRCKAMIAWRDGRAVGHVLWYDTFDPLSGTPGCYVMHLFVADDLRGGGIGRALLAELARRLQAEGGSLLTWGVLTWNEPARGFYRALGAEEDPGRSMRMALTGEPLAALARAA